MNDIIKQALKEDIGRGDVTARCLVPSSARAKAVIIAKENGIICGINIAKKVFLRLDKRIRFKVLVKDGQRVKRGRVIARISGPARSVLAAERTALNFLGRLSGIATLTNQFVVKVKPYKAKILDTRKTTPGLRVLEKYAVKCGGGTNHRMGLWDGVLIKENHLYLLRIADCGMRSEKRTLDEILKALRRKIPKKIPVEIEVRNLKELKEVLRGRPDIILLDNMAIGQIKKAVTLRNKFLHIPKSAIRIPQLEVSGRVTLQNVRKVSAAGVERISIGAITHSAKPLDLSLIING